MNSYPPQVPPEGPREKVVFRSLPIPVSAFDHIKDTQRALQATLGRPVTFNDTVTTIIREHKRTVEQAEQHHDQAHQSRTPAILR